MAKNTQATLNKQDQARDMLLLMRTREEEIGMEKADVESVRNQKAMRCERPSPKQQVPKQQVPIIVKEDGTCELPEQKTWQFKDLVPDVSQIVWDVDYVSTPQIVDTINCFGGKWVLAGGMDKVSDFEEVMQLTKSPFMLILQLKSFADKPSESIHYQRALSNFGAKLCKLIPSANHGNPK